MYRWVRQVLYIQTCLPVELTNSHHTQSLILWALSGGKRMKEEERDENDRGRDRWLLFEKIMSPNDKGLNAKFLIFQIEK